MEKFDLEPMDEESKILIKHIEETFLIDTVEPVYFINNIVGHEILTYNNKKLYLAKEIIFGGQIDTLVLPHIAFYNSNNVHSFSSMNLSSYWDSNLNQAHYLNCILKIKNILFSRCVNNIYSEFQMVGYKIILK